MDIRKKLNEIQNVLSNDQEEERNIVNDLMFLMFGRDSEELPREFEVECIMDNEQVETFLKEKLELDVENVSLVPMSLLLGKPRFRVKLN
jgi:hypothetical protein